jgi:hypothetical protein
MPNSDLTLFRYRFQVWAGNEACEPVTWRECKLVPRQVDFKVPKVECAEGEEIPYTEIEDAEKTQMTTAMTCEVSEEELIRSLREMRISLFVLMILRTALLEGWRRVTRCHKTF